ncbi:MAG: hypothetical protein MI865_05040, partial [Proteobacteria bacterium]|nr:hypothetical protein [Pseudomonadota bacterium]
IAFLSPVIISWWYLNFTDVITEGGKSNHGELISPPRQIADLELLEPIANKGYQLHGKWSMVYVTDTCDDVCINNLYRMRQIHIAMDKHSLRVQRVLFLTGDSNQSLTSLFADYVGQRVIKKDNVGINNLLQNFQLNETDDPLATHRLYIIDPLGNLMMSYPPDVNPRGIMKDLKKLLKSSRIG